MAATLSPPRILPSGDSAITVEFSRHIDDTANQRVLALDRRLTEEPLPGVTETVPTYRSLLVITIRAGRFRRPPATGCRVGELPVPPAAKMRRWRIPVVYAGSTASTWRMSPGR